MMPLVRSGFLAALLLTTSPLLRAADDLDDLLSLSLEDLSRLKLTTSTLTEETLRSVPSAMTVYTRAEIRRLGITELQQLAALVPGFQTARTDSGSLGAGISNRGRPTTDGMRSLLVMVDGQRLNNDTSGSVQTYESNLPLENVDRVEFIRGPGSAIYGTNAMSAVINVITRSEREFSLEAGNAHARGASAQWLGKTGAGQFELFANGRSAQGLTTPVLDTLSSQTVSTRDPYRNYDLSMRARFSEFTLNARKAHRLTEQFYVVGYVDNSMNQRTSDSSNFNLDWQHSLSSALTLQSSAWHNQRTLHLSTNVGAPLIGNLDERETGMRWLLQKEHGPQRWLLGWESRYPRITQQSSNYGTSGPENGRRINGLFSQFQSDLVTDLALTTGLRYDHYSDFGGHLSPRAGLVWQVLPKDTLKLLYSEAFRAPSRIETGITSSEIKSNPDLKPETAKTTELIWLHQLDQGLLGTTFFNTQAKDAFIETVDQSLVRSWENGHTHYKGLELEAQYRWQRWQTRLAATRLFKVDDPANTQSSNLLAGSLSYGTGHWSLALIASYHSQMTDPNEQNHDARSTEYSHLAGGTLWGLHLNWQLSRNLSSYLHGDNLFDRKLLYPADRPSNTAGVPGTGRMLSAGLRWTFD